jgi:small-conductance mechanosensitive channel
MTRTELILEIERKFRESGVEIPFPQRDLHLRSVDESVTSTSPAPGLKHLRLVPEEEGEDKE